MLSYDLNNVLLYLSTLSVLPVNYCEKELSERDHLKPVVAFKQNFQYVTLDPIKLQATSYRDLVTNGKVFVDNSLLLYDFLMNPLINLVLSPGKWGKSTNLDMVKIFLEPSVDQFGSPVDPSEDDFAFRLFHRGEIVRDNGTVERLLQPMRISVNHSDILCHYQGKQPIIFISLGDVIDPSIDRLKEKLNLATKRAILEHKYLHVAASNEIYFQRAMIVDPATKRRHLRMIERLMDEKTRVEEGDLAFLCEALHLHFRTKPFALIDDYDQPMHSPLQFGNFSRLDCRDISTTMDRFMSSIFTDNYHIQGAIITGRLQLKHNYWRGYHKRYVAEKDDPWRIYFGISDLNGRKIYHTFSSDVRHERMYRWYNRFKNTPDLLNYYNPWSFAHFVKYDKIECYNNDSFGDLYIRNQVDNSSSIRASLFRLISKQKVYIETRVPFTAQDIYEMRHTDHLFHTYLFVNGYILRHPPYDKFVGKAEITNCETAHIMATWILESFKRDYQVPEDHLRQVASHLWSLVNSSSHAMTHVETLEESLATLYKRCHSRIQYQLRNDADGDMPLLNDTRLWLHQKYTNQMNIVFYCVSLQAQILSKFDILAYYNRTRSVDVMMTNSLDQYGAAFRLAYGNHTAVKAMEKAYKCCVEFHKYKRIKFVKFVGISVTPEYKVTISQYTVKNEHLGA